MDKQGEDQAGDPAPKNISLSLRTPRHRRQQWRAEEGDQELGGVSATDREAGPPQLQAEMTQRPHENVSFAFISK